MLVLMPLLSLPLQMTSWLLAFRSLCYLLLMLLLALLLPAAVLEVAALPLPLCLLLLSPASYCLVQSLPGYWSASRASAEHLRPADRYTR